MVATIQLPTYPTAREDAGEDRVSELFSSLISDGVIVGVADELEVYADSTGMKVKVRAGRGVSSGFWGDSTEEEELDIGTAHSTNDRIDAVVLRLDRESPSTLFLHVEPGVPHISTPLNPTLEATDVLLAHVRIDNGVSTIAAGKVTDRRVFAKPMPYDAANDRVAIESEFIAGDGALGRVGAAVALGNFNSIEAYIKAKGSYTNIPLILQSQGNGLGTASAIFFQDDGGETSAYFTIPAGIEHLDTTLVIGRQLFNTYTLQRVAQGDENSGGTGYRALVVPN
jgi:hypothetical protein